MACAFGRRVKDAVEVGGDQPQRALTAARQPQQRRLRIGGTLAAQLGLQCLRQRATDGQALPRQAPLQQVERGVELPAVEGLALDVRECRAVQPVDLLHQPLEARQASGVGNARAAEEHHAALLVRLQERIGNVGTVGDELHSFCFLSEACAHTRN